MIKKVKLSEICDLQNGYAFKSNDYVKKSNTLNCRMSNIRPGAIFDIEYNPKYLPDEYSEIYKDYLLNDGDIIIAMTDLAGDPQILGVPAQVQTDGKNILLNQRVGKLTIKDKNKIFYKYLKYALSNPRNKEYYKRFAGGGLQINISKKDILSIKIPLPIMKEQIDIADRLDKIQEIIDIRKKQIEEFDGLIKARFVELFGDPETNPYKWSISKLSEFCDLQNGYAFKSQDYLDDSSVLNCRMSNIRPDGGFDAEYHPKYLPDTFWEKYKEYRLADGDVIIAMTDMASDTKILGVPTIVRTNGKKFLLNQRVGKLTFYADKTINNVYLMFVLSQKHIRQQLVKSAGGSTQINVGKPAVLGVEFFVPPAELQEQFAAFVAQTDKSKLELQKSLEEMQNLFDSLMAEYFG